METKHSNLNSPKKIVWTVNLSEGVTCTVYTRERERKQKQKNNYQGEKKFSDNYQQTVGLQPDNEKSPEEHSNTFNWALFQLQNSGAQSPF